jgi:hypothetical protein
VNRYLIMLTDGTLTAVTADRLREDADHAYFERYETGGDTARWESAFTLRRPDIRSVVSAPSPT